MTYIFHELTLEELKASTKSAFAMGPFGSRIKAENFVTEGIPVIKAERARGNETNSVVS